MSQMKNITEKAKTTPIRLECDVLVAGGGTAGVVAALAAARNGARTVLVERYGSLGGTLINGATVLHSFFNLYKAFPGVEKKQLVRGIPQEIVDRMVKAGGCYGHPEQSIGYDYDSIATCFDHEVYKSVSFAMLEEAGVKLLLHCLVVDTIMEDGTVQGIILESKSGREAVLAKVIIDATGDGDVAFRAGVPFTNKSADGHGVSMTFGMANVNLAEVVDHLEANGILTQVVRGHKGGCRDNIMRIGFNLTQNEEFKTISRQHGIWGPLSASANENDLTYINCTVVKTPDATDVEEMTRTEIELRKQVSIMVDFLKRNVPGFENGFLSWTSLQIGIRRTRIFSCEYDISLAEIENAARFEDEVALYGFHDCAPRHVIKNGGAYGIPYRALLPVNVENLLVAGRMITSDWTAHMSTRNTVSCMAQGQAAGTAAALCAKSGTTPRKLDTRLLRKTLLNDGVYLGQE